MSTPKRNSEVREEIHRLLKNEHLYGNVSVGMVIVRDSVTDQWRHGVTRVEVLYRHDSAPQQLKWVYEKAILLKTVISQDDFSSLLDSIFDKSLLTASGIPSVPVNLQLYWEEYLHSNERRFKLPWPANYYHLRHQGGTVGLPNGPFVSVDLPAFIDCYSLIKEQLYLDARQQEVGSVDILLPSYLARIDGIKLGPKHLSITVKAQEIDRSDLLAKVHLTDSLGTRFLHDDIVFEDDTKRLSLDFIPSYVYIGLLSKGQESLLDFRQFHPGSLGTLTSPMDVQWEPLAGEGIEAFVLQGENERVEFKLNFGQGGELAETVVAFANGEGGIILLGVDDHGNIAGYNPEAPENTVRNILRRYCEPPIDPIVETGEVRGKTIISIKVKEGADKPYTHREKGVMVRVGSTDRAATRDELDSFYKEEPHYR